MTVPSELQLDPSKPDFDGIVDQLTALLSEESSWDNIITSGSGQTLIRYIAAVGSLAQTSINRATQETILDTARLSNSIMRITRMLGVHIQRRNPSEISVRVTHPPTSVDVIPAYTSWDMAGVSLFNRTQISLSAGQDYTDVVLYQGEVTSEQFVSDGQPFQTLVVGPSDFSISDRDIRVIIDGTYWTAVTRGLWRYSGLDKVFYENTRPDGKVELKFGNSLHGGIPPSGSTIEVQYVLVSDQLAADIPVNTLISPQGISNVLGVSLSGLSDYQEHLPSEFYKQMSPALYSAGERAVTRIDHRAIVLTYPGVIDNQILGQAEINPGDVRWMNVISVALLTTSAWTSAQWDTFVKWYMTEVGMAALQLYRQPVEAISVNVSLRIGCYQRASISDVNSQANSLITEFFAPKLGSLGGEYHASDISSLIKGISDQEGLLIDYVDQVYPEENIVARSHEYIVLGTLSIEVVYSTRGQSKIITTIE